MGAYIGALKPEEKAKVQLELAKLMRWFGRDRRMLELTPSEVEQYAEKISISSSAANSVARLDAIKGFLSFAKKKEMVVLSLASHVRVRRSQSRSTAALKKREAEEMELTAEGIAQLQSNLEALKADRVNISEEIKRAASDKDVRENAPLEAAREQQGRAESRIREIEVTLRAAQVISNTKNKSKQLSVKVGTRVTVKDLGSGQKMSYIIVNPPEASPLDGKLSVESPVGKALLYMAKGQEVEVVAPRGLQRYLIMQVASA